MKSKKSKKSTKKNRPTSNLPDLVVRRSRGSVLIFVVALLTLVALIGTALIATARIDRVSTQAHVDTVSLDATRHQYTGALKEKVFASIKRGFGRDIDSPRTDSWLGDRLPTPSPVAVYTGAAPFTSLGNVPASETPMWRFPSGIVDSNDAELANASRWVPPLQFDPANPITLYNATATNLNFVKLNSNMLGAALVPSSVSITYPDDHPVETVRGRTRTFPAAYFVNLPTSTTLGSIKHGPTASAFPTYGNAPVLAGDADGDGIADALLFRLSNAPVDGVTYYGAIRVVDNNAAVNVNTAWARTAEFSPDPTNLASVPPLYTSAGLNAAYLNAANHPRGFNNGFFTSNVGLYELLDPTISSSTTFTKPDGSIEGGNRPARDNEMAELDEFRLGYPTGGLRADLTDKGGWVDAFEDYITTGPRTVPALRDMFASRNNTGNGVNNNSLVGIEDISQDPGAVASGTPNFGNQWNPDPDGTSNDSIGNFKLSSGNAVASGQSRSLVRPDFLYLSQNEALATQASRRWESIRYGVDMTRSGIDAANFDQDSNAGARATLFPTAAPFNVDKNVGDEQFNNAKIGNLSQDLHALFPYRWFDEQEAASLAYRFCLVDPQGNQSTLETILRHSAYRAAPNWRPNISDTNPGWSSFPANEFTFWFQTLNFDLRYDGSRDTAFDAPSTPDTFVGGNTPPEMKYREMRSYADAVAGSTNTLVGSFGGQTRFRSARPLLTTHNPVNTSNIARSYVYDNTNSTGYKYPTDATSSLIDWDRDGNGYMIPVIHPGMLFNDMVNAGANTTTFKTPAPWVAGGQNGVQYQVGDMVYNPAPSRPGAPAYTAPTRLTWMLARSLSTANANVAPWDPANIDTVTGEYKYWEPQPWVSGWNKASINTAGFPELWHAFYLTMANGVPKSPFDSLIESEFKTVNAGNQNPPNNQTDLPTFFPLADSQPNSVASAFASYGDQFTSFVRFYDPYRGMRFDVTDALYFGRTVDTSTGIPTSAAPGPNGSPDHDSTAESALYNVPENPATGGNANYEQNSLSMFRSVIRDPRFRRPDTGAAPDADNPDKYINSGDVSRNLAGTSAAAMHTAIQAVERLTPFQMMTLRSAIAAFNAQDMLNTFGLRENAANSGAYDPNDIPAKTIVLYDTNYDLPNPAANAAASETAGGPTEHPSAKNPRPQYEVTIYGNRPQLFISEVFVSNDAHPYDFLDAKDVDAGGTDKMTKKRYQNPNGYVAIELYNPYPVSVNTSGWMIGAINREASAVGVYGTAGAMITAPGGAAGTVPVAFPAVTVGPGQRLVIESYDSSVTPDGTFDITDPEKNPYASRQYRPPASGIVPLWDVNGNPVNEQQWYYKADTSAGYPYTPMAPSALSTADPKTTVALPLLRTVPSLTGFISANAANSPRGRELVILRPRKVNTAAQPQDMVPVDQFDFTGVRPPAAAGPCQSIHYARPDAPWQVVYPGRYDGCRSNYSSVPAAYTGAFNDIGPRRHEGIWVTPRVYPNAAPNLGSYDSAANQYDPWISPVYNSNPGDPANPLPYDMFDPVPHTSAGDWQFRYGGMSFGQVNSGAATTYVSSLAIPLLGGPIAINPLTPIPTNSAKVKISPGQNLNQFPFGGFARNGDILQVPFIAAYRIRKLVSEDTGNFTANGINPGKQAFPVAAGTPGPILEMNSISMDAAFAEDTNPNNNTLAGENVGRMANVNINPSTSNAAYSWCANLFRYLDVRVPANDYLPDVNPSTYPPGSPVASPNGSYDGHHLAKPVNNRPGTPNLSIKNTGGDPSGYNQLVSGQGDFTVTDESNVTTQGLININTASPKVLSMLPLVANNAGQVDADQTRQAAQDIFDYVTKNADLNTLFDLNRITQSVNFQTRIPASANQSLQGDIYPMGFDDSNTPKIDDLAGGYKQQYEMITRISNLVTTKSDTFTVYLLVQGWREAGTQFPALDWEERQAFIVDRSTGTLRITRVPTD